MKKIAIEEHFMLPEHRDHIREVGVLDPNVIARVVPKLLDIEHERLSIMDSYQIEKQVLSAIVPGGQTERNAAVAIRNAKYLNDMLAEIVSKYPQRFAGFAALPLQDPQAAADELERAVKQLGLKGALYNGHTNGEFLDEQKFWIIWERAEALGVPIYLHPGQPLPGPLSKFYEGYPELLGPVWNWGFETATQALRLVFSGVFDTFPRTTLILGHMGEMLPYVLWRLDARSKASSGPKKIKKLPSEYIKENVVITTSGQLSNEALLCALQALGADHIIFSVDYPFESMQEAAEFIESAPISDTDKEKICYRNVEQLLRL